MPELSNMYAKEHLFNFAVALKSASANEKLSVKDVDRVSGADVKIYNLLGKDLMDCLFEKSRIDAWDELDMVYRQAWFDEIRRRLRGRELCLLRSNATGDEARFIFKKAALHGGSAMPSLLHFSQFKCNAHFQTAYDDSPSWIADKPVLDVARALRDDAGKSVDFRISVSSIGRRWIAWNNRGFTAHCLANVMPMRIVPNPKPSVAEQSRLGELIDVGKFNYSVAEPSSRRDPGQWEATAPCTVISIVEGGQGTGVVYTVKNGFCRDNGNATVLTAA